MRHILPRRSLQFQQTGCIHWFLDFGCISYLFGLIFTRLAVAAVRPKTIGYIAWEEIKVSHSDPIRNLRHTTMHNIIRKNSAYALRMKIDIAPLPRHPLKDNVIYIYIYNISTTYKCIKADVVLDFRS